MESKSLYALTHASQNVISFYHEKTFADGGLQSAIAGYLLKSGLFGEGQECLKIAQGMIKRYETMKLYDFQHIFMDYPTETILHILTESK